MSRERWFQIITLTAVGVLVWTTASNKSIDANRRAIAADAAGAPSKSDPVSVLVVKPKRQDLTRIVRMTADVRPWRETEIYGQVAGYVVSDPLEIGTRVNAGDTLLKIGVPEVEAAVGSADKRIGGASAAITKAEAGVTEAQEEVAQAKVRKMQAVVAASRAKGMIASAEASVAKARATADTARRIFERLEAARERSPNLVSPEKVDEARGANDVAQAEVRVAEIGVEAARDGLKVAEAGVEAAEAGIRAAQVHVKSAESSIAGARAGEDFEKARKVEAAATQELAEIKAPYAGVVANRMVELGELVRDARRNSGAKSLYRLIDDSRLRLRFFLSSPDAPMVRIGNRVVVTFDEHPEWKPLAAKVSRIADVLDRETRTMEVEVDLWNVYAGPDGSPANLSDDGTHATSSKPTDAMISGGTRMLRADTFARVTVDLETRKDTLVVPINCVKTKKRKSWVMTVDPNNIVRKKDVTIGASDGLIIELSGDGIDETTSVIIKGSALVADKEMAAPTLMTKE